MRNNERAGVPAWFRRGSGSVLITCVLMLASPVQGLDGPVIHSFEATVADTNRIELRWRSELPRGAGGRAYIYGMGRDDVGIVEADCAEGDCSVDVRAPTGGYYRFVLTISTDDDAGATRTVEAHVDPLPLAVPESPVIETDVFEPEHVTISWNVPGVGEEEHEHHHVEIAPPGVGFMRGSEMAVNGSTSSRELFGELKPGDNEYKLRYCRRPGGKQKNRICSETTKGVVRLSWAEFSRDGHRIFLSSGRSEPLTLDWGDDPPGGFWLVDRHSLDGRVEGTLETSTEISPDLLKKGVHKIRLVSCVHVLSDEGGCSGFSETSVPALDDSRDGTAEVVGLAGDPEGPYIPDGEGIIRPEFLMQGDIADVLGRVDDAVATLEYRDSSGEARTMAVPPSEPGPRTLVRLPELQHNVSLGDTVEEGDVLLWQDTGHWDSLEIVVDGARWQKKDIGDVASVERFALWQRDAHTGVNNVVIDGSDIWAFGEFSNLLMHVDDARLTHYQTPRLCHTEKAEQDGRRRRCVDVEPFGSGLAGPPHHSAASTLNEDMILADGKLWFAEGGALFYDGDGNHARIVSFDPDGDPVSGKQVASSPYDGRFCVYNVPGDRNEVTGLAWVPGRGDRSGRIWFTERTAPGGGDTGSRSPAVSSFAPDEAKCDNFFDYEKRSRVTEDDLCKDGHPGCFLRVRLPSAFRSAAQLAYDKHERALWFTDFMSISLGRLEISSRKAQRFQAHWPVRWDHFIGAFPWRVRADDRYVYFNEFMDASIVRFDKRADRTECEGRARARNPCMEEVHVPTTSSDDRIHSIALDPVRPRIWFTLRGGRIGWLSTRAWDDGDPCGVIYRGLAREVAETRQHVATRIRLMGIDLSRDGQVVAVGDASRQTIYRLKLTAEAASGCGESSGR